MSRVSLTLDNKHVNPAKDYQYVKLSPIKVCACNRVLHVIHRKRTITSHSADAIVPAARNGAARNGLFSWVMTHFFFFHKYMVHIIAIIRFIIITPSQWGRRLR